MGREPAGTVYDIQRLCVQDGPGIRTTVFLKGCPLRCQWCHNPESLSAAPQFIVRGHKCALCGACVAACPNGVHRIEEGAHLTDFEKCTQCGECLKVCCYDALELAGRRMTTGEVADSVEVDRPYFAHGGGATLSGGEPLAQPQFATALARELAERGISVCLETCGHAPAQVVEGIAPHIDLFLYDYKATDSDTHKWLTGVSNERILENLALLDRLGRPVILRCPFVHGMNDSEAHLRGIAETAAKYSCIREVQLLPYHRIGETKRMQMGQQPSLPGVELPSPEVRRGWVDALAALGCEAKLV